MGRYFGTDGFRGEANKNLTVEHAYKVGRFIGWQYHPITGKKCKVVIGKDTRRSSYMFEYSLVAGLTASGADAYLLHVTTTPDVYKRQGVHTIQHTCPVTGLCSTGTCMQGHNGIVSVVFTGQQCFHTNIFKTCFKLI